MSQEKILQEMQELMQMVKEETRDLQELLSVIEEEIKAETAAPSPGEANLVIDDELNRRLKVRWGRMDN
ncbi:MAG: hypothetical protein ACOZF0_24350 [Thermodesulfobacteriota bacterium]